MGTDPDGVLWNIGQLVNYLKEGSGDRSDVEGFGDRSNIKVSRDAPLLLWGQTLGLPPFQQLGTDRMFGRSH